MTNQHYRYIAWELIAVALVLFWSALFSLAFAGDKPPPGSPVDQAQQQGQTQGQDQSSRSQSLSIALSTPGSTAPCIKTFGAVVVVVPWSDKDCKKVEMYHVLMGAGLETPAYTVLCSTRTLRGIYGSPEVCLLELVRTHIKMCADRQQRIDSVIEECSK